MNFQDETLPDQAVKVGSTPSMTNETVVPGILRKHLAPKGKYGLLVVEEGALQFVWEDDDANVLDADPNHPIVIAPERYHHVVLGAPVRFRVEFYSIASADPAPPTDEHAERPGEPFA
jgi:tellurite resistance-related uncharacterized protein